MKICWLVICLAVVVTPGLAQDARRAEGNAASEADLTKVEAEIAQLIVRADWDHYEAWLMDDYSASDRSGVVRDKEATMSALRAGNDKVLDLSSDDLKVRVYGDTAIVSGHYTMVQRRNGRVDTFFSRETHVYLKRGGIWLLAASQATSLAK